MGAETSPDGAAPASTPIAMPTATPTPTSTTSTTSNFITDRIDEDLAAGRYKGRVATRFPPEPNGYLHIGHAKSICLNFGLARKYGGLCNLRFDDTNPEAEDVEYVESIKNDVRWLGFSWDNLFFASDYYEKLYECAEHLIKKGSAYVDSLSVEELRKYRGNYFVKAQESPYRGRSVEENLDLFRRMRAGEFEDGAHVLRAKIDLNSQNMNLRDPPLYRIRRGAAHHRTGHAWCIYPTYDYAHPISDAIEGITHSICTLEFENHRPLYDWVLAECIDILPQAGRPQSLPQQIEFARLNLTYTVLSKRKLLELVGKKHVAGWDDPRMPTLAGLRRRGFTPEALRAFCDRIGVAKRDSIVDVALLEHAIREDLNERAPRVMAVLSPLKIVITNYPEDKTEEFDAPYFPDKPGSPTRKVPFCRELYIERDDFREDAPKKWYRLSPGREIRLRWACLITCQKVIKDDAGNVVELHCTMDENSRGGNAPDGRRVQGTSHWVSARHAVPAEVRLYDRLFMSQNPSDVPEGQDWKQGLNPGSLEVKTGCLLEPSLKTAAPLDRVQFERLGYFCLDPVDSTTERPVWNRTVTLRDSWSKLEKTS
jgi:glutaminyl-tRNA synthetase